MCTQPVEVPESCLTCNIRPKGALCALGGRPLHYLNLVKSMAAYPPGSVLFTEGQNCRHVVQLCSGRAKLTALGSKGKSAILKLVEAGELLGVSEAICDKPYSASLMILEPSIAVFIRSNDFLNMMRRFPEVSVCLAQQLSREYFRILQQLRDFHLALSAEKRLVRLILQWAESSSTDKQPGFPSTFTHADIARMIGTSRETVSRLLKELQKQKLISGNSSGMIICDPAALQKLAAP